MKISIIIATYNSSSTLEASLQSIRNLNFDDWECVVVDGKSTDNTIAIIESYSNIDHRFRYISEKDNGIYDALNKGVKLAVGDWIYVLGSDDTVCPNGLGELLKHTDGPYSVIYGNVYTKSSTGIIDKSFSKKPQYLKYGMLGCHQGIIMKKSELEKLGGFNCEYPIRADFDLMQKAYLNNLKFLKIDTFVACFNKTGISNSNYLPNRLEIYYILKRNKLNRFPFLVFMFEESIYLINRFLLMPVQKIWSKSQ